eukprot:4155640-Pyramimonas_sp.AAC.1
MGWRYSVVIGLRSVDQLCGRGDWLWTRLRVECSGWDCANLDSYRDEHWQTADESPRSFGRLREGNDLQQHRPKGESRVQGCADCSKGSLHVSTSGAHWRCRV